jgi:hypothetical protein
MQEFELRVVPERDNAFGLELYQRSFKRAGERLLPTAKPVARLKSQRLVLVRQAIYQFLKADRHDPKTLSYRRQAPYVLSEEIGVAVALLFQAIQPLSRPERIQDISQGISAMSKEEAHYWFAKVSNGRKRTALRAMRILLGG